MSRQPISTADSGQTADLIAQHAALLPLWLNYVDGRRAEQQKLQLAMRTHTAPAGAVVEAPVPVPAAAAPTKGAVPADPNPVAWLRGHSPASPPATAAEAAVEASLADLGTEAAATWLDGAEAAATGFEPAAPAVASSGEDGAGRAAAPVPSAATVASEESPALPGAQTGEAGQAPAAAPPAAPPAAPTADSSHAAVLGLFEGDFGGDVSQEFDRALAETDEAQLPYGVREAMQYGQEPEEVAAAFVRSARAGELPDRLGAAVERMEEVDYHFRNVGQRLDSPTTDDDPEGWF